MLQANAVSCVAWQCVQVWVRDALVGEKKMDLTETCWGLKKTVLSWHKKARVCQRLGGLGLMGWSALCRRKSANATQQKKKEKKRKNAEERLTRQRINRLHWSITRFVRESLWAWWSKISQQWDAVTSKTTSSLSDSTVKMLRKHSKLSKV